MDRELLDQAGEIMTAGERGFWENVVGCVLACHVTASFKREGETVQSAFLWADVALKEYRKRLEPDSKGWVDPETGIAFTQLTPWHESVVVTTFHQSEPQERG